MAAPKIQYVCAECGATAPKWSGQCSECGVWNSLSEIAAPATARKGYAGQAGGQPAQRLDEVAIAETERWSTGMDELDRVLGGGVVPGSAVLLGGDPGIGKSTLLLQTVYAMAGEVRVLYVTGEESLQQVAMRARRLGLRDANVASLAETSVERILHEARRLAAQVMVVDSIQTVYSETVQSAPGAVAQVRESAAQFARFAKGHDCALFLVGHVTKEGGIAGPRVLEHIVDAVLYFEGGASGRYRVVRALKNRFGAVNELGVFGMTDVGLKPVANPSALFLSGAAERAPGSAVMVTWEGTRPLLVEIQALLDDSHLANPRRVSVGLEQNRLAMLLAVLHRRAGVAAYDQDVFLNAVGGVRVTETASDVPVLLAVLSSFRDRPLPEKLVSFGEVGLGGEIRPVYNGEDRLREAAKQGFKLAAVPKANRPRAALPGLEVLTLERVDQLDQLV